MSLVKETFDYIDSITEEANKIEPLYNEEIIGEDAYGCKQIKIVINPKNILVRLQLMGLK